jgi:hypothetical protein
MEAISLDVVKLQGNPTTVTKQVEDTAIKADAQGNGGQSSAKEVNSYYRYDTLELSPDYLEYKTKGENSGVESDTSQLNAPPAQQKPLAAPSQPADQKTVEDAVSALRSFASGENNSENTIDKAELSTYTNAELKSLMDEGRITVAEYNTEVKSRAETDQTTQKNQSQTSSQPQMQNTKTQNTQNRSMVANPSII